MTAAKHDPIDFTMMYATHNAFRRDLDRLVAAVGAEKVTLQRRDGWDNFKAQLLLHHSVEDTNLWPALRQAVMDRPQDLALVDDMETEHAELAPQLAAVDAALGGPPTTLTGLVLGLTVTLADHLRHEEETALPLMQSVLTPAAWRGFAGRMRRRQGIKGAAVYVPWVLDGASPDEQQQFLSALPAPVRLIARRVWVPRYRRRNRWNAGDAPDRCPDPHRREQ